MPRAEPSPSPCREDVRFGLAELLADAERAGGWLLRVNGVAQSYVDVAEPRHLEFEYVQWLADLLDLSADPPQPLSVLHLGGGAATLPRYVAATRPGSPQLVLEADGPLADLVRRELGTRGFRLRVTGARAGLADLDPGSSDAVVCDAFAGSDLPRELVTAEFLAEVQRVLRPHGTYLVNLADSGRLGFARAMAATVLAAFPHAALVADPAVLRGRRFGNLVLAGSAQPLAVDRLPRRHFAGWSGRVLGEDQVRGFAAGQAVLRDATVSTAPAPPPVPSMLGR